MYTSVFSPPPHILPRSRALPRTGKKICSGCGDEWPIENFRPKKRIAGEVVGRHTDCDECHRKTMRRLRAKKKSKEAQRFVSLASKLQDFGRMAALVNAMWSRFGGIGGLAQAWKEEMERAKQHLNSPARARCLMAFVNLLMVVEQNKPPEPSLGQMSDEELAVQMVASMMQENPESVVMIGEAMGWTMVPRSTESESQGAVPVAEVAHP